MTYAYGNGRTYQPKGCKVWWIQYNLAGRTYRESSKSWDREDAIRLLGQRRERKSKTRLGRVCRACGSDERYISTGGCAPCSRRSASERLNSSRDVVNANKRENYKRNVNGYVLRGRLKLYGLTIEEFQKMVEDQQGVCAICQKPERTGRRLSIDHDHRTKRIRGLLCVNCNRALGNLLDDVGLVRSALSYLERHQ